MELPTIPSFDISNAKPVGKPLDKKEWGPRRSTECISNGCPVEFRWTIVDPSDQVVRAYWCKRHNHYDYMFPEAMMIKWPDNTTEVWQNGP